MEFGSGEFKTTRGIPHSCCMANVWPAAREESGWVMVVSSISGCSESSGSADNHPLHGRVLANCRKLHRQLTDLGALCGSGKEEGFAGPTFLVGSANGLESGERWAFGPFLGRALRVLYSSRTRIWTEAWHRVRC